MVTIEEMEKRQFTSVIFEEENENELYRVTDEEMNQFKQNDYLLGRKLAGFKGEWKDKYHQDFYTYLELKCCISMNTFKKAMAGNLNSKRNFLYKLAVGFKMTLDEANNFFELAGGTLREECKADYLCIKALSVQDPEQIESIEYFAEQFQKFTGVTLIKKARVDKND